MQEKEIKKRKKERARANRQRIEERLREEYQRTVSVKISEKHQIMMRFAFFPSISMNNLIAVMVFF